MAVWILSAGRLWAAQDAILAWDPSSDSTVVGYYLYFGQASGNYTSKVDAGTNVMTTVYGLAESATYYFVATAYNAAGVESAPCNEAMVTTPSSGGLQLSPIASANWSPSTRFVVTNNVSNPNALPGNLTYSLDPGAPAGMSINPVTGMLWWTPSILQGGTTNVVTVRISDGSTPPNTDTQTFTIVLADASQLNLGPAVIAAGGTGTVAASLSCSGVLSNLSFELIAPAGRVTNFTVQTLDPNASVSQTPLGPLHSLVQVQVTNGQFWQGVQAVAQIYINASPEQTSSFATMGACNMNALQPDGTAMTTVAGQDSKLVFVGRDSLLEAQVVNGSRQLVLYGPVGGNYLIQSTANLASSGPWTSEFTTQLTNLFQVFPNLTNDSPTKFYRARNL